MAGLIVLVILIMIVIVILCVIVLVIVGWHELTSGFDEFSRR